MVGSWVAVCCCRRVFLRRRRRRRRCPPSRLEFQLSARRIWTSVRRRRRQHRQIEPSLCAGWRNLTQRHHWNANGMPIACGFGHCCYCCCWCCCCCCWNPQMLSFLLLLLFLLLFLLLLVVTRLWCKCTVEKYETLRCELMLNIYWLSYLLSILVTSRMSTKYPDKSDCKEPEDWWSTNHSSQIISLFFVFILFPHSNFKAFPPFFCICALKVES